MDPVVYSFHAPRHDLELVARHVVRDHLADHLILWKRMTGCAEMLYMATCQRTIWVLWGGNPEVMGLNQEVARYEGEAGWRYMLEVATGLLSANLGDREIVDQLRTSLEEGKGCNTAGDEATAYLDDILREAQRLRSRLGLADGSASVATAALRHLEQALKPGAKVALVGVGPMTQYLAQRLPERGFHVTVSNRTLSKAEALGLPVMPLGQLQRDPGHFDALVSATASHRPLFTLDAWSHLQRHHRLRVLDLALPPDTEPALEQLPWVHRIGLEAFLAETEAAKAQRRVAADQAEPHLLQAVTRLRKRGDERSQKSQMKTVQQRLTEAWDQLEQDALAPGTLLGALDGPEKEALNALLKRGRTLAFRALNQGSL